RHEKTEDSAHAEENEGNQSEQMEEQAEGDEDEEVHVTETELQGQADEGERIPIIMEQMHNEDEEAEQLQQGGDSSDEEGDPVPAEWTEQGFGNQIVQYIRCTEWTYRENEVVQGTKYQTIDAVKKAVKLA